MRIIVGVLVLAVAASPAAAARWVRANFHAHAANDRLQDDGTETPRQLHEAMRQHGVELSVHSVHSSRNVGPGTGPRFLRQAEEEARLVPGMTIVLGQELTVRPGPNYQRRTVVLGHAAPGNMNHVTVVGVRGLIPHETPLADACTRARAAGGLCLVNHPGPGPMMWEKGLWEAPGNRGTIDGLEVYNGQALATVGVDFEGRYREATAYGGLGLKIAAVAGADTHGPQVIAQARVRLAGLGQVGRLLRLALPGVSAPRPELQAQTLVHAESARLPDVVAAVRARRTIATFGLAGLGVELPGLGEVRRTGAVALRLRLSRRVAEVVLYREAEVVRSWRDTDEVAFEETITRPGAYVFAVRDGGGRLLTSAIWYEPPAR